MLYLLQKIKSGILGLAIGDAVGVPVEFKRGESLKAFPITDMTGYGAYNLPGAFYIKATGHNSPFDMDGLVGLVNNLSGLTHAHDPSKNSLQHVYIICHGAYG